MAIRLFFAALSLIFWQPAHADQSLQAWIDTALPGTILRLPPGIYRGPASITKPLTLEGNSKVIVDGSGKGTVLTIKANRVTIRGLTLRASGDSHDAIDGAIMVTEGNGLLIENNVIEDVLFGISLHRTTDSVVRHNRIR